MPVSRYEALIVASGDERIVATSGITCTLPGATMLMLAASAAAEIEGRITSQQALPSPLRLKFSLPDGKSWTDGSYHVKIVGVGERNLLSIWAEGDEPRESEPTSVFNHFLVGHTTISRGLLRLDLNDVKLPPVVVHVEVSPVAEAGYAEEAQTMIDNQRGPGFKLLRGFHGQFLATSGEHTINVFTYGRQHVLATTVVNVNPANTTSGSC